MMLRVLLALILFVSVGLVGCAEDEPTPGQQLDRAIEDTRDAADDMADEAEDAADEAEEAVENAQ